MYLTNRMKAVLVLPILMFSTGQQLRGQCSHGGGRMSTGGSQGRMQSLQRQSMLSASMNQPQQSSLSTGLTMQQNNLLGMVQPQQQLAMLATLQQLQQSRQLSALQQPPNSALASQPGQPSSVDNASRRRQRRLKSSMDSDAAERARQQPVKDASTDEEIAARRLWMAKDLADYAQQARGRGEYRSAAKLRERAGERLLYIVETYSTTSSANEARSLMQGLNHLAAPAKSRINLKPS